MATCDCKPPISPRPPRRHPLMANKIISSIQFKRGAKVDLERILVGEKRP